MVFPRFAKIDNNLTLLYSKAITKAKLHLQVSQLARGVGGGGCEGAHGPHRWKRKVFAGADLMVYSFYTFKHGKAFERGFHMTIRTAKLQALATLKLPSKGTKLL